MTSQTAVCGCRPRVAVACTCPVGSQLRGAATVHQAAAAPLPIRRAVPIGAVVLNPVLAQLARQQGRPLVPHFSGGPVPGTHLTGGEGRGQGASPAAQGLVGVTRETFDANPVLDTFFDPVNQLAQLNPIAALAALDPRAALATVSPVLRLFNPALNPAAALLAFNPQAAPALAITNPALAGAAFSPLFAAGLQLPFLF